MSAPRIPASEQYRLVMECRQSGLSDHQWCLEHGIKPCTHTRGQVLLLKYTVNNQFRKEPDAGKPHVRNFCEGRAQ